MIELQPWAETLAFVLIVLAFHLSGWALAAPIRDTKCGKSVIHWKFLTGVIGLGGSILALVLVAVFGRVS